MSNSNLAQSGWNVTNIFAGVAVGALLLTFFGGLGGGSIEIEEIGKRGENYFQDFDSTMAVSLQVTAFDAEKGRPMEFRVERNADQQWVIPSHHNYPADAQDRLGRTASSVMGIKRGAMVTRWKEDHANYGVVDPRQDTLSVSDIEGVGSRVTILQDGETEAAVDIIIGDKVEGQQSDYYVRSPSESEVYITTLSNVDLSVKFSDWINTDLLEVQGTNIERISVFDYEVDENEGTLSETELSVLSRESSSEDWQLEGLEDEALEVDADALTDIVSALDDFEIAGVRPKRAGLTADLALDMELILAQPAPQRNQYAQNLVQGINQDLLRGGFRLQPGQSGAPDDMSLLALQGELEAGTNEGVVYRLYFGRAFAGSQDELEIGLTTEEEQAKETEAESEEKPEDEPENVEELDTQLALEPNVDDAPEAEEAFDPMNQPGRYVFVRVSFDESLLGDRPEEPVEPEKPEALQDPEGPQEESGKDETGEEDPAAESSDTSPAPGCDDDETSNGDENVAGAATPENDAPAEETAEPVEQETDDKASADAPQENPTETPEDASESEVVEEEKKDPEAELEALKLQYEQDLNEFKIAQQSYATELENYERQLEEGQEKAADLNRRFALWYYVIPGPQYDKLRLDRAQLIREKTDEPEAPPAGAGGLPGGLPGGSNLPPGLNLPQ